MVNLFVPSKNSSNYCCKNKTVNKTDQGLVRFRHTNNKGLGKIMFWVKITTWGNIVVMVNETSVDCL